MRRIWLIGGTSDARELAALLVDRGFSVLATVATEQGEKIWHETPGLEVRTGRLNLGAMEELLRSEPFLCVVDGSHPYASEVSANARAACGLAGIPLLRLGRPATPLKGDVTVFDDAASAAVFLRDHDGRALLTLGSKELEAFASLRDREERLIVRILPDRASFEKCEALGLGAANIIAMKGPFSREMNLAMLRDTGARWLVTKDGGARGGMPEKLEAAAELKIPVLMIRRPEESGPVLSEQEILERLLSMTRSDLLEKGLEDARRQMPFPLFLNLENREVLLAGGGPVAARRAARLLSFGVKVHMVAPEICPAMERLIGDPCLRWERRPWRGGDEKGAALVLAATDDPEVNRQAVEAARRAGILANRADVHGENDFLFPAVIRSGEAVAAVSTGGDSPSRTAALASRLREQWPRWVAEMPIGRRLRVASRESVLAVAQSRLAMEEIEQKLGEASELITMKTTGDVVLDRTLDAVGGKGLFIKELERSLLEGRCDLAVHSLKDMPAQFHPDLTLAAILARDDPRDCLVLPEGDPRPLRRIGTSSRRRSLQGMELFPDVRFMPLRGNVLSRLKKLDRGEFDGLILAVSGLKRLGLENRIGRIFQPWEMIPSAGQGALAVECRRESWTAGLMKKLDDQETAACCQAERAFIAQLGGGCSAPHAAYGELKDGTLHLRGLYVTPGDRLFRGELQGCPSDAEDLGRELAKRLKAEAGEASR